MKSIQSAIHPKTNEVYNVGDTVCIYQGRFGHNNIITIKSMWQDENDPTHIMVSKEDQLPGTNLSAVKHKMTEKMLKDLRKAKALTSRYS